jgi:hypothetical protein
LKQYDARVFCGRFSTDGDVFMTASQDEHVRVYKTHSNFQLIKDIECRACGWSIIDVDFSPDNRFLAYSSWSPYVQLCNIYGEQSLHEALQVSFFCSLFLCLFVCFVAFLLRFCCVFFALRALSLHTLPSPLQISPIANERSRFCLFSMKFSLFCIMSSHFLPRKCRFRQLLMNAAAFVSSQ